MSDMQEKLEAPQQSQGHAARATLEALKKRYGFEQSPGEDDKVCVYSMGEKSCWVRISGRGAKAIFELVETAPEGAKHEVGG